MRLINTAKSYSELNESYRLLRSNLRYLCKQQHCKLISFSSATPGEGVTEVAVNMGMTLAKNSCRVLLMDCNLMKPSLHLIFDVPNKGLTDSVTEEEDLTIHKNVEPRLDVVTAGRIVDNPADVIDSERFDTILQYVRREYDYVIVDTPPLLALTDATVIAEKSDGIVLVAKSGHVSPDDLKLAKKRLHQIGVSLLGAVLKDA